MTVKIGSLEELSQSGFFIGNRLSQAEADPTNNDVNFRFRIENLDQNSGGGFELAWLRYIEASFKLIKSDGVVSGLKTVRYVYDRLKQKLATMGKKNYQFENGSFC